MKVIDYKQFANANYHPQIITDENGDMTLFGIKVISGEIVPYDPIINTLFTHLRFGDKLIPIDVVYECWSDRLLDLVKSNGMYVRLQTEAFLYTRFCPRLNKDSIKFVVKHLNDYIMANRDRFMIEFDNVPYDEPENEPAPEKEPEIPEGVEAHPVEWIDANYYCCTQLDVDVLQFPPTFKTNFTLISAETVPTHFRWKGYDLDFDEVNSALCDYILRMINGNPTYRDTYMKIICNRTNLNTMMSDMEDLIDTVWNEVIIKLNLEPIRHVLDAVARINGYPID